MKQVREYVLISKITYLQYILKSNIIIFLANLPPLCTPKDVGTRILLQARQEAAKAATQTVEMDMESDSGDEDETTIENETDEATTAAADRQHQKHAVSRSAYEVTQPMPAAPLPQNVLVREYDPKKGL
jgi:hypothetical protein